MLNWLKAQRARRAIREARQEALGACGPRPPRHLMSAITATATDLGPRLSRGELRPLRGQIILILARQLADANERLRSSHWTGSDGHNVGKDVLQAWALAAGVVSRSGSGSIEDLIETLASQSTAYRSRFGDPDGYGSATLGEIERDLQHLSAQTVPGG